MFDQVIIGLFVAMVEFVVAFEAYYRSSNQSKTKWWLVCLLAVIYLGFSVVSNLLLRIFFVNIIVCAMMFLSLSFAFDIGSTKSSVHAVLAAIIVMAIMVNVGIVVAVVLDYEIKMAKLEEDTILLITFFSKLVLLVVMQILAVYLREDKTKGKFWHSFAYLTLPIATFVVLFIQSYLLSVNSDLLEKTLIILCAAILTISNIVALSLLERLGRKEKQLQLELFRREELEKERGYYERTIAMATQSNKTMHDLKHILYKLYEQGEVQAKDNSLIAEVAGIAKNANVIKYTALSGLNVLFNSKFNEIASKNIDFEHHIFIGENIKVDEIDLCVLFGNLIDNALEAAEVANKKFIKLTVAQRKEYITINMSNGTNNQFVQTSKSSKDNKLQHGFGLRSICDIAEKYEGDATYNIANGIFEIAVMLKNVAVQTNDN